MKSMGINMIEFKNISKTYKVAVREGGMKNAMKSLFTRNYKTVHALNDVSFQIAEGEMVGYIGPNGAGKSTTIKIMCGILTPDSGQCVIDGSRKLFIGSVEEERNDICIMGQ